MKKLLLLLALVMVLSLTVNQAMAATMSASLTAPVVNAKDIANYGTTTTNISKWFTAHPVMGQTFTVGSTGVMFKAVTYLVGDDHQAEPTKDYVIRIGTVDVSTGAFTEIYTEGATQTFKWNSSEYMTWTLDTPVYLEPDTERRNRRLIQSGSSQ